MVPVAGFEPAWVFKALGILSPLRLPFRHTGNAVNQVDPTQIYSSPWFWIMNRDGSQPSRPSQSAANHFWTSTVKFSAPASVAPGSLRRKGPLPRVSRG